MLSSNSAQGVCETGRPHFAGGLFFKRSVGWGASALQAIGSLRLVQDRECPACRVPLTRRQRIGTHGDIFGVRFFKSSGIPFSRFSSTRPPIETIMFHVRGVSKYNILKWLRFCFGMTLAS